MRTSFQRNKKGIYLIICSAVLVCVGQLLWKLSVTQGVIALFIGFIFYGVGALSMLVAYRYGQLSILQPMLSLNYVLSAILGLLVLHETFSLPKGIGIVIITLGVILIGGDNSGK